MSIVDIFWKRQKRLREETPDIYEYTDLPIPFRRQVIFILNDISGDNLGKPLANQCFQRIHNALAREFAVFNLDDGARYPQESVHNFFLRTTDVEKALSVIEVSLWVAQATWKTLKGSYSFRFKETLDNAVVELNTRFQEHSIGYQFESNKIVRVDSQFLHKEAVRPALRLLTATHYAGADEEFRKAHEHYRHQRYGEAVNECLKSLESILKVICKKRQWPFKNTDTANALFQIVFERNLVPDYLQSQFTSLRAVLESGVPTIRNREGGHGSGEERRKIPPYLAAYVLHLTASAIVFLSQCDKKQ